MSRGTTMRNLLWILVAVLVIGGGYLLFTGKSVQEVLGLSDEAAEEAAEDAGEAADAAGESAEEAAEAAASPPICGCPPDSRASKNEMRLKFSLVGAKPSDPPT